MIKSLEKEHLLTPNKLLVPKYQILKARAFAISKRPIYTVHLQILHAVHPKVA